MKPLGQVSFRAGRTRVVNCISGFLQYHMLYDENPLVTSMFFDMRKQFGHDTHPSC